MRARRPDLEGYADCAGVKVAYEVFGEGNEPTIVLVHGWHIAHSRLWKMQVPYLARHYRVVTFDWPGNGRSDRPDDPAVFSQMGAWVPAVMDATGTASAILAGHSWGCTLSIMAAATFPERVTGLVLVNFGHIAELVRLGDELPAFRDGLFHFEETLDAHEGWARANRDYWTNDFDDFLEFWWHALYPEPHSTKPIEDGTAWSLEADRASLGNLFASFGDDPVEGFRVFGEMFSAMLEQIRCPALVIAGSADPLAPPATASALADALGADYVLFDGSGHGTHARDPVHTNLCIREFVDRVHPPGPRRRTFTRAAVRPKRALFVSSPIGLGHALRDVAIADELRKIHPDLEIHWLAQHPVTRVLEDRGETIHPASAYLASESAHWESEADEHDLHAFQALRRMDEILLSNFMLFQDVVSDTPYDAWICDEAWDVDYFLHENPELKRAALVWLTDFVGFLPLPEGGEREAGLTSDYNAEMIAQIARYPRLRDRALFVGNPDDVVPDKFGQGQPRIREWTEQNFAFPGYISGFTLPSDRLELRDELGYRPEEKVCVVAVGGSGVGTHLLRRLIDAYPAAARAVPGLRMVVVAGPRIDPASLRSTEGVEVRGYVPELYKHLAACDVAVVQGGLTTCMELAAARRPFLYVPLRNHFEQSFHVRHRLERYRAGRCIGYDEASDPDGLAHAIARELGKPVDSLPVETDGAAKAAEIIGELI
jgi:pimeloyl-ACP methyl ester carboxylesterase